MNFSFRFFVTLALLWSPSSLLTANPRDEKHMIAVGDSSFVKTKQGLLLGQRENGVFVWKGIPYAQAPVDSLRYVVAQPPLSWNGLKAATSFGPIAHQPKSGLIASKVPHIQSEDCLYLNVWTPAPDNKKRPVMVWIHGGGFELGSGSADMYDGAKLATKGDMVIVTLNYRLGVLGFLYFDEADSNSSGFENNLGIRDQVAALRWVKENIDAFGGDPNQVTVFGESAGGTSVETLLAAREAKGLFQKAIVQSGPASIIWTKEVATMLTNKFLSIVNVSPNNLSALKQLQVDTLKAAQKKLSDYMMKETNYKVFSPTIDGRLLNGDIYYSCLNPEQSGNVSLMIGTNRNESSMFAGKSLHMMPSKAKDLEAQYLNSFSVEQKNRIVSSYESYPKKKAVFDILTDGVFRNPAIRLAECQGIHSPVYMYRFDFAPTALKLAGMGAFHGLEIPFVFGNREDKFGKLVKVIATNKTGERLTEEMQTAWLNFARSGNPNGTAGNWQPYDQDTRATMLFNKESKVVLDPDSKQRMAWEGVKY